MYIWVRKRQKSFEGYVDIYDKGVANPNRYKII